MNCSILVWSLHHHWLLWVQIVFENFSTVRYWSRLLEFLSSYLKFDCGRSIGRAAVVILIVNLFVIKVRSELRGCGHTGYWWTIMSTILTDWWLSTDYCYCLSLSLIFIDDTLSDIKGEFDVVILLYCIQNKLCLDVIDWYFYIILRILSGHLS